eukprot:12623579-Alexandrium_andersonii.AAC.1
MPGGVPHENVEEFPVELLGMTLNHPDLGKQKGSPYIIETLVVNSSELGNLNDRKRRLTWLRHRRTLVERSVPWPAFLANMKRECRITWAAYFNAPPDELAQEALWAARRSSSQVAGGTQKERELAHAADAA